MKVTIDVTQIDIDCGFRESCTSCPVALATNRVLDRSRFSASIEQTVIVDGHRAAEGMSWHSHYPPEVDKFICAFDKGLPVQPFQFELDIPDCFLVEK